MLKPIRSTDILKRILDIVDEIEGRQEDAHDEATVGVSAACTTVCGGVTSTVVRNMTSARNIDNFCFILFPPSLLF